MFFWVKKFFQKVSVFKNLWIVTSHWNLNNLSLTAIFKFLGITFTCKDLEQSRLRKFIATRCELNFEKCCCFSILFFFQKVENKRDLSLNIFWTQNYFSSSKFSHCINAVFVVTCTWLPRDIVRNNKKIIRSIITLDFADIIWH